MKQSETQNIHESSCKNIRLIVRYIHSHCIDDCCQEITTNEKYFVFLSLKIMTNNILKYE